MNNINELSSNEQDSLVVKRAAQESFRDFCVATDPKYDPQWFHDLIAAKLQDVCERVERGESPRLMIFVPPRHGKSETSTKKFPAWVLGKHPDYPIIVSTYSQDLSTKFGQDTRDIMASPNYQAIFDTRLRADTQAKASWMTEEKGGYEAVGVGGSITGKGFKIGIIDDPVKNEEEAESETIQESRYNWYKTTFYTRQEGNAAIIVILTRWNDKDLAGKLLDDQKEAEKNGDVDYDKWEIISLPAIAEVDDEHREVGDTLWPSKFSLEQMNKTKKTLGSYKWSALYQQNPVDEENKDFKQEWFKYRTLEEVRALSTRNYMTIDSRGKDDVKKGKDFHGITRNYADAEGKWNLRSERRKINGTELIDLMFRYHAEDHYEKIGFEDTAYYQGLKPLLEQEMQKRGVYLPIVELQHFTNKELRILSLVPRYEFGGVYHVLVNGSNDCVDLEEELLRFPRAVNDDASDSAAMQNEVSEQAYPDDESDSGFSLYGASYG